MTHSALLGFEYETSQQATRVQRAIQPEVGDIADERTQVTVSVDTSTLRLHVEARDLVGLRAGLNTWTALVETAEAVGGFTSTQIEE